MLVFPDRGNTIARRISEVRDIGAVRWLGEGEVDHWCARLDGLRRRSPDRQEDFARWSLERPKQILRAWIMGDERCEAFWPWSREGVELSVESLVAHLDDLWYPSSDDLWLGGATWMVLIDHEEFAEL